MPNFDYRSSPETLYNRFQEFEGLQLWHTLAESPNFENFNNLRTFGLGREAQKTKFKCPRVFISHRKYDTKLAVRIAQIVSECSCEYWLDVLDPMLQPMPLRPLSRDEQDILIAGIIEMAPINCTHVLAVMTPQSERPLRIPLLQPHE